MKSFKEFIGISKPSRQEKFSDDHFIRLGSVDKIFDEIISIMNRSDDKKKLFDLKNKESMMSVVMTATSIIGMKNKLEYPIDVWYELVEKLKSDNRTKKFAKTYEITKRPDKPRVSTNISKRFTKVKGRGGSSSKNDPNSVFDMNRDAPIVFKDLF